MATVDVLRPLFRRTFASLRAGYDPEAADGTGRVVTRERYEQRRRDRESEMARPRGRLEFPLIAPGADEFVPDGSMLLAWAREHEVCCRKLARRILALIGSGHASKAVHLARGFARVRLTRWDRPRPRRCQLSLEPVIAQFEHREWIDWEFWSRRSRPEKPYRIDAAPFVWERRDWEVSEVLALLELIEALPNSRIHWPDSAASHSSLLAWVADVQDASEAPPRLDQRDGFWNRAANPAKEEKFEPVTSSLEDDNKWFSVDRGNVSRFGELLPYRRDLVPREVEPWSRSYAPSDSHEAVWESVKYMAYKQAKAFCVEHELHGHLGDLVQIACITVIEARATYDGRAKFSTYVHKAIYNAMVDYRGDLLALESRYDYTDDVFLGDDLVQGAEEFIPERLDIRRLLREIPDLKFVLTKLCGFADDELGEKNVRVRRHRATKAARVALTPSYMPM